MQNHTLIKLIILLLFFFVSSSFHLVYSQSLDDDFILINRWHFPNNIATGYVWDAFLDMDRQLSLMFFRDGIKIISSSGVEDLTRVGQGPGEMERWVAMFLTGPYLIDVERSGKLIYFKKDNNSYKYDKTLWLDSTRNFPFIKGAVFSDGKWYLAGFSSIWEEKPHRVHGYFLSVYKNGKQIKQLFYKDFNGIYRGPNLLTAHIKLFNKNVWMMLASEPEVHIFDTEKDILIKKVPLRMPEFYRPIQDYIPWRRYSLDKLPKIYEDWELSYSRIENFIVNEKYLTIQIRTANPLKPKFAMLFFDTKKFALNKIYFCNDLLLTEKDGEYYFFENGDPGFDEEATCVSIKIYKKK